MTTVPLTEEQIRRYSRQILLPEVGGRGQRRLLAARVWLAGSGGIAEFAGLYLAAAGVGRIGVTGGASGPEAGAAGSPDRAAELALRLAGVNPDARVTAWPEVAGAEDLTARLADLDLVLAVSGEVPADRRLQSAALAAGRTVVWTDRVGDAFRIGRRGGGRVACAECLTAGVGTGQATPGARAMEGAISRSETDPTAAASAVTLGALLATEALGALLGLGAGLTGRVLEYRPERGEWAVRDLPGPPACPICGGFGPAE